MIDREDYMEIFMSSKEEMPEHIRYLTNMAFTRGWPIDIIKNTPSSCRIHYYRLVNKSL